MTLEELLNTARHEFESLGREMATKEELGATEGRILRAIEGVDRHVGINFSHWSDHLDQLDGRIQQIERRVNVLENSRLQE